MWNTKSRSQVYQMQRLCVSVMLGAESMEHQQIDELLKTMTTAEIMATIQEERDENLLIIETAVDELCNVLEISNRLRDIKITFLDIGHARLKTGQEHRVLKPFAKLRNLHRVRTYNVPDDYARSLKIMMKRK